MQNCLLEVLLLLTPYGLLTALVSLYIKRIVCTLVRSNKLFLLTGVATTTDTKAPPISQAYLVTYINVFLLFSIRLMFYKVLCCMFTYLYHRNSFLLNNATSVSFLVLLHGNRWRCFSQCFTSSKS